MKRKKKSLNYKIHPDSHMYFGQIIKDRVIGDKYFSIDI